MIDMVRELTPVQTHPLMTGEELVQMGDIGRCELIEAVIVMRSPTGWRHGKYESRFNHALKTFVNQHQLGEVLVGETGIYTRRNPDTVRGADVAFISNARLAQVKSPSFLDVAPEIIVEVMSPDDRWSEVKQKIREYFAIGAILVWVADPSDQTISVYRALTAVRLLSKEDTLSGEEVLPGFSLPVAALFAE